MVKKDVIKYKKDVKNIDKMSKAKFLTFMEILDV